MTTYNYPTLSALPDGATWQVSQENPAIEGNDTDGGYWVTRRRYTRTPPKSFSFSYADISHADMITLQNFWNQVGGSSSGFNWVNPVDNVTYNVRFGKGMKLDFQRIGFGANHRFSSSTITLTEI